jgi:GMP synthase (glutamine-hydrolysing)
MRPLLVIEQEQSLRGLGLLGDRLDASGLPYRRLRAWDERLDELRTADFSGIVAMGGNAHAWDEESVPLMRAERALLRGAVDDGVPVLGICLGGQLLARALGGDVREADRPEIGWLEIAPTDAADDDPLFRHLTGSTGVYQWHHDVFELPPGARRLASSLLAENQAFRADGADAWGIQFHPEVDAELWEAWISRHPKEVREASVDVDGLRADVRRGIEKSLPFRTRLFDAFLGVVRTRWRV